MQSKRLRYIDLFRGFGIILMILGHINIGSIFDKWIHPFHMPMFFFASALFFKPTNFNTFFKKKVKTLLLPYICVGLIHYVVWMVLYGKSADDILAPLRSLLWVNTDGLPIAGSLWFLTALFITEILFYFVNKVLNKHEYLLVIPIALFGCLYANLLSNGITLPFGLDAACVGVGFYYIGYLIGINQDKKFVCTITNLNWLWSFCGVILASIVIFINGYVNMRIGQYSIIPLFWISSVLMIVSLMCLAKNIVKIVGNKYDVLSFIGKNSIVFLCFNQVVIIIMNKVVSYIPLTVVGNVVNFLCTVIILFAINKVLNSTKLSFVIGKNESGMHNIMNCDSNHKKEE